MSSTSEFVTIGRTADIPPGQRVVIGYKGYEIIVFNVGGEFYAIEDLCSHEEEYLSDGVLDDHAIECPKHSAKFDIRSGKPLCPPAFAPVKRFAVRVEGDQLQIGGRLPAGG